jgi:hypothetical protein
MVRHLAAGREIGEHERRASRARSAGFGRSWRSGASRSQPPPADRSPSTGFVELERSRAAENSAHRPVGSSRDSRPLTTRAADQLVMAGVTATSRETVEYRGRTAAPNIPTRRSRWLSRLHLHETARRPGTGWSRACFINGHDRHRSAFLGPTAPPGLRLSGYATPAEGLTIESRSRYKEKWY